MKKKWQLVLLILAVAVLGAGIGAYAATTYGTQQDPLVTVSYLNQTLTPYMTSQFDGQLSQAMDKLENDFTAALSGSAGTFRVMTLSSGQTLSGGAGCEILYRSGPCAAAGALVDVSAGGSVASGTALTANHLYMTGDSGAAVKASGSVTLLVRGVCTVG